MTGYWTRPTVLRTVGAILGPFSIGAFGRRRAARPGFRLRGTGPRFRPHREVVAILLALGGLLVAGPAEAITFDVGPGVPPEQVAVIETGLGIARTFLESDLGGDIPESVRNGITVKVVATGLGNQEVGGGGACCTAFSRGPNGESVIRPFFDVAHPAWTPPPQARFLQFWTLEANYHKTVVHEYAHGWQHSLGCISMFNQPLGFWMNEGIAEQVAYEAMIQRGAMRRSRVMDHMVSSAWVTGQLERPLSDFGGVTADLWPGHVGYVALNHLLARTPEGIKATRSVCETVAAGTAVPEAFEAVFGITLEQFYAEFETWRQGFLGAPWLDLVTTKTRFVPGEALEIDLVESNLGAGVVTDLYLGTLLPADVGPAFGCPGGDAVAFATEGGAIVVRCLSAPPQTFPVLTRNVSVAGGSPPRSVINFYSGSWPLGAPTGTYVLFVAYVLAGSLSDGRIDPGDVIAIGSEAVTLSP